MFSYIRRLGSFLWGFKILNINIFLVFRKMKKNWGMTILWIFFGGVITKLDYICLFDLILYVHSTIF